MRILVDTNVLLRAAQPNHPLAPQATHAVSRLLREEGVVFFCPQNIAEFWSVATRPIEMNGLGFSDSETAHEVNSIERLLTLLPDVPAIYPAWKQLVRTYGVQGVKVHDARLVAVMGVYRVEGILTFNVVDFKRYSAISVLQPTSMLA